MNQKLKNESDLISINCTTSPFTRLKNWQRIRQERGPNLTFQFCLCKLCVSSFLRQVRTIFFWGGVGDMDLNRKKNRVRTSFLMLTSACARISLIAFPIPQSHIKIRSGPQNVLCKHDLPNSVFNSLFVHGNLLSVLKLCGLKHFPKGTALQTRLAKKHLIQEIGRCIFKRLY